MKAHSLSLIQKRWGWKEWFIQDPPKNDEILHIWAGEKYQFEIDPSFQIFEIEGIVENAEPVFILPYLFSDDMELNKLYVNSYMQVNSKLRHFKVTIKRGVE